MYSSIRVYYLSTGHIQRIIRFQSLAVLCIIRIIICIMYNTVLCITTIYPWSDAVAAAGPTARCQAARRFIH